MRPIYSVALTVTQGEGTPTATATLGYHEETQRSHISLSWDLPCSINAGGNPGEWLYAVLSRLVQDFDDHTIERVAFETDEPVQEDANA